MADEFEGKVRDLFADKNFPVLSVARPDGTVLSVVLWADAEDGQIAVNSAEGRQWPELLRRSGTATLTVFNDGDPYEWAAVVGRLTLDTHDGAEAHIDSLSQKYLGVDYPAHAPDHVRIKFLLEPEHVRYVNRHSALAEKNVKPS